MTESDDVALHKLRFKEGKSLGERGGAALKLRKRETDKGRKNGSQSWLKERVRDRNLEKECLRDMEREVEKIQGLVWRGRGGWGGIHRRRGGGKGK